MTEPQQGLGSWLSAASKFTPLILLYITYTLIRWLLIERGTVVGEDHAMEIVRFERWSHIDIEHSLQTAMMHHEWMIRASNVYYVFGFFPILIGSAWLAATQAPVKFSHWRRVFTVSLGLAILCFTFFPLTPPRLLPSSYGFKDTLLIYGPHYYGDASGSSLFNAYGSIPSFVNVHAAMPSMHVGWSIMASLLMIAAFPKSRGVRIFAILHPILMGIAVVGTGNHYVIDIFAGIGILLLSAAIVALLDRWRAGTLLPIRGNLRA